LSGTLCTSFAVYSQDRSGGIYYLTGAAGADPTTGE
jgi:hypothetical protein